MCVFYNQFNFQGMFQLSLESQWGTKVIHLKTFSKYLFFCVCSTEVSHVVWNRVELNFWVYYPFKVVILLQKNTAITHLDYFMILLMVCLSPFTFILMRRAPGTDFSFCVPRWKIAHLPLYIPSNTVWRDIVQHLNMTCKSLDKKHIV